jgi:ankyrin repeat protein
MIRPVDLKDDDVWNMFQASWNGDLDQVKALVSRRRELALCEYNYTPPIHFAVREGHLELVRFLLEQGADPTYRTYPFQDTLLTMAQDREYHQPRNRRLAHYDRRVSVTGRSRRISGCRATRRSYGYPR